MWCRIPGLRKLLLVLSLGAIGNDGGAQSLHFQRVLGRELPNARVLCLAEDSLGGIWVGTTNGLARILGDHVRVWEQRPGDTLSIQANEVRSIDASDPRKAWVGTSRGLCSVDPISGQVVRHPCILQEPGAQTILQVWQVVRGDDEIVWVSSSKGLICFDVKRASWFRPAVEQSRYPGTPFRAVPNAMVWDQRSGVLWVGTKDGLYRIEKRMIGPGARPVVLDPHIVSTYITCLAMDQHGELWMNDPEHFAVLSLSTSTGNIRSLPLPVGSNSSSLNPAIMLDAEQNIWLAGNDDRLYRKVPGTGWEVIAHDPAVAWSPPNTSVNALLAARNGVLWFGTDVGLVRSIPLPWGQEMLVAWAGPRTIGRLCERGSEYLIATNGSGVVRYDAVRHQLRDTISHASSRTPDGLTAPAAMEDMVNDMLSVEGGVLLATKAGLLFWRDGSQAPEQALDLIPDSSKPHGKWIDRVAPGSNGAVWVLVHNHGLWKVEQGMAPVQVFTKELPDLGDVGRPCALAPHPDGGVWCGTSSGFLVRTDASGRIMHRSLARSGARLAGFTDMVSTGNGMVWAGFDDGTVGLFDAACQGSRSFERKDGMPGGPVIALALESGDRFWVLSENGSAHVDTHRKPMVEPVILSPEWGRPTAIMPLREGEVVLAFTRALVKVGSSNALRSDAAVTPLLAGVVQGGKYLVGGLVRARLRLTYDQRAIRVQFSAVGAVLPEELKFRYRTAPDRPWVPLDAARSLDLYDLAEGEHRIAFAINGAGEPDRMAELELVITPPWYRTRAALVLWVLLMVLMGAWAIRTFIRRKLSEEKERSQRERSLLEERIRIAHDLHDDLGSSLAMIAMEGELASMSTSRTAESDVLKRMSEGARDVTDSMRRIVWALGSGQDTLGDLVAYIRSSAAELMENAELELTTRVELTEPGSILGVDQRRHLLLATKELLLNVVKHAGAKQVMLSVHDHAGSLQIEVSDDGCGFDVDQASGTGTTSVQERVKALHGDLTIRSAKGTGTTIRMQVPLHAVKV
jgi:signal transduction histidine kinase/ligand-binding sensor domain-containing protein